MTARKPGCSGPGKAPPQLNPCNYCLPNPLSRNLQLLLPLINRSRYKARPSSLRTVNVWYMPPRTESRSPRGRSSLSAAAMSAQLCACFISANGSTRKPCWTRTRTFRRRTSVFRNYGGRAARSLPLSGDLIAAVILQSPRYAPHLVSL